MADYVDLEIQIEMNKVSFRVDGADYEGKPNFDEEVLTKLMNLRLTGSPAAYGSELLQATFQENAQNSLRRGYDHIRRVTDAEGPLRLRLNIDLNAKPLHKLWWECLFDSQKPPRYLGCYYNTPLSRYLPLAASREKVTAEQLKVLVVISNPRDLGEKDGKWPRLPKLCRAKEQKEIHKALAGLEDRIDWTIHNEHERASLGRIGERLKTEGFHVLHIIGHGAFSEDSQQGYLLLEKAQDGSADPVDEERLAQTVANLPELQLIVLAACRSAERSEADAFIGLAPRMIEYGVPAVIAMQDQIAVEMAWKFTQAFYGFLTRGQRAQGMVDVAMNDARDLIYRYCVGNKIDWEWSIPVLFMRGDGRLFEPAPSPLVRAAPRSTLPTEFPPTPLDRVVHKGALSQKTDPTQRPAVSLYDTLRKHFPLRELSSLCFRMQIADTILRGKAREDKALSLVQYCESQNLLEPLQRAIEQELRLR